MLVIKSGARDTKLSEPLTLETTDSIQWHEPRVDLADLANHCDRRLHAITNYSQNIRRKDFKLP
jgi:hypothetical protein